MEISNNEQQHSSKNYKMRKIYMFFLALYPLLYWYDVRTSISLGVWIMFLLSTVGILKYKFRFNIFQSSFWLVFVYVCSIWSYREGFALWTVFPPGGWQFFIFFLSLVGGTLFFDLHLLTKFMKWIVWISIPLFWIQFAFISITGSQHFCFVPNLTDSFTYEGFSYAQLVSKHLASNHPCSIFLEKSYMGYYLTSYLCLNLFNKGFQWKWRAKENIAIVLTLLFLRSGSGIAGLALLIISKLFSVFWNLNWSRRIALILLIIPMSIASFMIYEKTEMGQEILSRESELTAENSSGYNRVIGGYFMFEMLSPHDKMVGIHIEDARKTFGFQKQDGTTIFYINGIQMILFTLGYLGLLFYILFYYNLFKSVDTLSRICILILLLFLLLESNYLSSFMTLLTIIPCGIWYHKRMLYLK